MTPPVVLAIAATDSGGGAGLAADLATFAALGVHGACVVTAVTAQDTTAVHAVHPVPTDMVAVQLDAVLGDLPVAAVKTGVLGSAAVVRLVAERCAGLPIVVDPVIRATTGATLATAEVIAAYREYLLPSAAVLTPNAAEARALLGHDGPPERLAAELAGLGPAVVVTGGQSTEGECVDWLALPGHEPRPLHHPAVPTTNDHGTGCTFSAAFAAHLAEHLAARPLHASPPKSPAGPAATPAHLGPKALRWIGVQAARFTTAQLTRSTTWDLGRGRGPIAHVHGPTVTAPTATATTGEHR
jgi:hydroxymethylpyrimidine/phosphomethylpyrimidine kinase